MRKFFLINFVLVLLAVSSLSLAEENKSAEKETKLEDIVVTATKSPKELADVPASISVVTKKDIEKRNVVTVDEALEALPGVVFRQHRSIMTTWPTVTLRGIPGQRRTLVLMDGVALHEPLNGGVRYSGYAPEDLEKIEVVRGPFSSLYGGYAMGGVVNMITKMPEKRELSVKAGYGSSWTSESAPDSMSRIYLSYGDKFKDKLSLFLSYGYKSARDFVTDYNVQAAKPPAGITGWSETTDQFGAVRYLIGDQGNNDWWDEHITVKAGYDFSKLSKLRLSYIKTRLEWDSWGKGAKTYLRDAAGNPVWSYGTVRESTFIMTPSMGSVVNLYNINYETEFSDVKAKLTLGLHDTEKRRHATHGATATRFGGPAVVSHSPSKAYVADVQFTKPLLTRHVLTFGASYKHDLAEIQRYNLTNWRDKESTTKMVYQSSGKANTYAFFIQDEIMLLDNLTAYIGLRHDWWHTFDGYDNDIGKAGYPKQYASSSKSSFSPKASVIYKPFAKTTLRTSFGTSFRPPVISELYGTFLRADMATSEGDPNLKPETTMSWDFGIEQGLWKGAKIGITCFQNYMSDFIQNIQLSPTLWRWTNVEKSEGRGVEIEAEQKIDNWLRFFANFTYNETQIKENPAFPKTVGKMLTEVPKTMFNVGVEMEKGRFSGSVVGRHKSKIYLSAENLDTAENVYNAYDPHFVMDAKVSYKITKWATASISADNIFDNSYFIGARAPGRSWYAEMAFKF